MTFMTQMTDYQSPALNLFVQIETFTLLKLYQLVSLFILQDPP